MSHPGAPSDVLLPLVVVVPLLVAAGVSALNPLLKPHHRLLDAIAITTSGAVTTLLVLILVRTSGGQQLYWFAGVRPHHGIALGVDFAVGSLNAGLAALAGLLVTASMVFSWRYFEQVSTWFHALMLMFLAGMVGFCLTGDLFDLFVWFEVMGVAAYALTAYRSEEKGPLQGALNFAITNSVAAYLSLMGIALVYARTGALNMAQIGHALAGRPADGLVIVAFVLILIGLLTKSAIVPFHFWLADAHAVAPTPVCVLFSGVMVELGLYGVARVYWSIFGDALGHRGSVTAVFMALGVLTALVGAVFAFRQRHLKRLLAFSTVSHAGLFLMGLAVLSPLGLAGSAAYVIGHGLVKAALFLCAGIVLHRLGTIDETELHGRGRELKLTGAVFTLAALGLADLPPFATYLGAGWVGNTASSHGMAYVTPVVMLSSIIVGGAVLRAAGGIFFGLGDPPLEDERRREESREETSETEAGQGRTPLTMLVPAAVLVVADIGVGLVPGIGAAIEHAAMQLEDQAGYVATVLHGAHVVHPITPMAPEPTAPRLIDVASALGTVAGSVLVALAALYRRRLPVLAGYRRSEVTGFVANSLQSGVVNDYVTWMMVGLVALGGALAFSIH